MEGKRMARVIPELGQFPSLRWAPGRELLAFSMLMREVFFGARHVLAARCNRRGINWVGGPVVNRLPAPVILQRLFNQRLSVGTPKRPFHHPSYPRNGLPLWGFRL